MQLYEKISYLKRFAGISYHLDLDLDLDCLTNHASSLLFTAKWAIADCRCSRSAITLILIHQR